MASVVWELRHAQNLSVALKFAGGSINQMTDKTMASASAITTPIQMLSSPILDHGGVAAAREDRARQEGTGRGPRTLLFPPTTTTLDMNLYSLHLTNVE